MLFENETLNITKLDKVISYSPKHLAKYAGNLPTYEIMYYVEGESVVNFNGKKYEMQSDHILYLPKGVDNKEYSMFVKKKIFLYNIYFDTADPLPNHPVVLPVRSGEIKLLFEKLYRTWVSKQEGFYYRSMRYTYNIFELLRKQQPANGCANRFARLAPSEAYLSAHYCDHKFDYAELVKRSGLSYSYFKKLFIEKYGVAPVKRVNQLKINYACELLETGRFAVGQIAQMCGFENTYYFSTVFKNHTGVCPKHYISK